MELGTVELIKGRPNPHGVEGAELFLLKGDVVSAPVREIVMAQGVQLPARREDLGKRPFRLRIMHINDMHGHISRFRARGNQPVFSKIMYRLQELRQHYHARTNTAVLFLSAGDDCGGTVLDELLGATPEQFTCHPAYHLYSMAGLDVGLVGNHDLDKGSETLAYAIRQDAQFPILSANLINSQWLSDSLYPAAILLVKGIRVGIIGLSTPAAIRPQVDSSLQIVNPVQVVHNLLPALRPLCDVTIILSHLGYTLSSPSHFASVSEAGDVELARSLPYGGVHLIVGGHTHHNLNHQGLTADNIVNGIPIVQAGMLGNYLGEVDITVREACAAVTNVRLTPTNNLPVNEAFEMEHVQPLVEKAKPLFRRELGQLLSHPDLSTDAVRNNFAAGESALANFITDALVARGRSNGYDVDLAIVDTSSVRSGLPNETTLVFSAWFRMMPFSDTVRLCWLTGKQLKELLDDNARRADRPAEPHTERGFLHFSRQLRYVVNLTDSRATAHATQIMVNDIPIEQQLERSFLLACSNFVRKMSRSWEARAGRLLNIPFMDLSKYPHLDPHLFLRDELVAYIRDRGGVTEAGGAKRDGRVEFVGN